MQEILTYLIVFAAVAYLARKVYISFFAKKEKCESCAFSKMGEKETNLR
jgi:hypothetical protein